MESSVQQTWIASEVTYFVFVWASREVRYTGLIWNSHKLLLPFSVFCFPPPAPTRCPSSSYAFPGHFYQGPHQTLLLHKASSCWLEQLSPCSAESACPPGRLPHSILEYSHVLIGLSLLFNCSFHRMAARLQWRLCSHLLYSPSSPDTHHTRLMCNQWDSAEIADCDSLDLVTKGTEVFSLHSVDPWPWEKPGAMSWGQSSIPLKRSMWGRNEASCQ